MYLIVFLLVSCSILFLLSLFLLTKDDFIILRKDISMERIFNFAILASLAGLFSARLFYVIFNFQPKFLNLFVFFLFAHFPGLSLVGAVIGGSLFSFVYLKAKKMPALHLFDFLSISFFVALPAGCLLNLLTIKKNILPFGIIPPLSYLILLTVILILYKKARIEDGSLGFLGLNLFSVVTFLINHLGKKPILSLGMEDFVLIIMFLVSLFLLVRNEKILSKFQK